MAKQHTMKLAAAGGRGLALGALLVLASCANTQVQPVVQGQDARGMQTLSVGAEPVVCSGPRCPQLAASWSAAKPGQAVLSVALAQHQVRSVDFHLGPAGVVRLRQPAAVPGEAVARFDVPLRVIAQIAYTPRSWLRVYTADGVQIDESLDTGEARARASEALGHFLTAVQAAGGKGGEADVPRGGLLERLGIEGEKKVE